MRDEELLDPFSSFLDHVVQHVDDVVVLAIVLLGDLVDGVLELLVVPDGVRDILLDVDIPFFELLRDIPMFSNFSFSVTAIFPFLLSPCRTL